jgi:hypothetical protein
MNLKSIVCVIFNYWLWQRVRAESTTPVPQSQALTTSILNTTAVLVDWPVTTLPAVTRFKPKDFCSLLKPCRSPAVCESTRDDFVCHCKNVIHQHIFCLFDYTFILLLFYYGRISLFFNCLIV